MTSFFARASSVSAVVAFGMLASASTAAQTVEPGSAVVTAASREHLDGGLASQVAAPPADDQNSTSVDRTPFWTTKKLVLIGGIGGSLGAGGLAWSKEMDLRARKRAIQALPAGATDEWNRQLADAKGTLNARDFWGAVAIGLGSVTTIYAITTRTPPELRSTASGRRSISLPKRRSWDVRFNPVMTSVSVDWSF